MELFKMEIVDDIIHSTLELLDGKDVSSEEVIPLVILSTCKILELVAVQEGREPVKFVRDTLAASAKFWYETYK